MFFRLFAVFALLAVAFASPKPDYLTYSAPGVVPLTYSGYSPVAYSAPYVASPYAAAPVPYAYSSYYFK